MTLSPFRPAPSDVEQSAGEWRWQVQLDPAEPYLNDHRPGGHALLGMVGGLEVMSAGVAAIAGDPPLTAIQDVTFFRPILFNDERRRFVGIRARRVDDNDIYPRFEAALSTWGDGGACEHMRCSLIFGAAFPGPANATRGIVEGRYAVTRDDVYALYFHGPAYRLIARAGRSGERVLGALAQPLPGWTRAAHRTTASPRLMEFGLQTAGLLQLALDGTMMVPRHVDQVIRHAPTEADDTGAMLAVSSRRGTSPDSPIDIDIMDAQGGLHMQIRGYHCVPLPFAADAAAMARLSELLNKSDAAIDGPV